MAEYRITSWREIPSMVSARSDAGEVVKVPLPDRFQEAIDELAMRTGAAGSDDYLADWVQGEWAERARRSRGGGRAGRRRARCRMARGAADRSDRRGGS